MLFGHWTERKTHHLSDKVKGKGIALQAWEGSWGSMRLRLLDLLDTRHCEGGKIVTLTHRPSSPPESSWYSLIEAESTPGYIVPSEPRKKSQAKPPRIDPETLRLVPQCRNYYATPLSDKVLDFFYRRVLVEEQSVSTKFHSAVVKLI